MGLESFDVFRFDLGPLLEGEMRIAKLKSTYNSFIIIFRLGIYWIQVCAPIGVGEILSGNILICSFIICHKSKPLIEI